MAPPLRKMQSTYCVDTHNSVNCKGGFIHSLYNAIHSDMRVHADLHVAIVTYICLIYAAIPGICTALHYGSKYTCVPATYNCCDFLCYFGHVVQVTDFCDHVIV